MIARHPLMIKCIKLFTKNVHCFYEVDQTSSTNNGTYAARKGECSGTAELEAKLLLAIGARYAMP